MSVSETEALSSHPINWYPSLGVAVMVTSVPSSNVPPSVTLPPSPAVTVKVYWTTTGSGVSASGSGVIVWTVLVGACVSSSGEQLKRTNKRIGINNNFLKWIV